MFPRGPQTAGPRSVKVMDDSRTLPHPWEADFSSSVSAARAAARLSEEELARRVREYGLPFNAVDVRRIESGAYPIGLNEALVVRKILEIDLPEVTKTAQERLIHGAYAQALAKLERDWAVIVADLARSRRNVLRMLRHAEALPPAYTEAIKLAGGTSERDLITALGALIKQISDVKGSLAETDSHLGGALSATSAQALLPGSQT